MSFLADIKAAEARVSEAIVHGHMHDVLNAGLASELICVLHYERHYYMMRSIREDRPQVLFEEHWRDAESRLGRIAERLEQLGGVQNVDPERNGIRPFSPLVTGYTLVFLLREALFAKRVVIVMYGSISAFFGSADPVSRRMFEAFREDEESRADEIAALLYPLNAVREDVLEKSPAR
jgi:bacterioferritin